MTKHWRIIRQDSNGNRFIEQENLTETLADKFVQARERRIGDHHQTMWKQDMDEAAPYPHVPVPMPI